MVLDILLKLQTRLRSLQLLIPAPLLVAYYLGLPLKLIVGISFVTVGIVLYRKPSDSTARSTSVRSLLCLLSLYPIVVFLVQVSRWHNGTQGVDFAIFSQVVHNFSSKNELQTSLIDGQWHHFLTHHFSPYLYAVGFIDKVFNNPELLLLALHSLTITSIVSMIFLIAFNLSKDIRVAALLATLSILLPAPRIGLLWEVRDEIFALPFLLAAFLFFLRGEHMRAVVCLVATMFFKETLLVASTSFCIMALAISYLNDAPNQRRTRLLYGGCFLFGCAGFLLYTKVLPGWLFWPTFNPLSRVSTISQLLDPNLLRAKIWWLTTIIAPITPLLLIAFVKARSSTVRDYREYLVRPLLFLLPAAPFVAMILLSNSDGMSNPYNYYSILPALLITVGVFTSLRTVSTELKLVALLFCCLIASFIGPRIRIPKEIKTALMQESPVQRLRQIIPPTAVVLTGDWDAALFIRQRQVMRLYHANKNIMKFDFIVLRKTSPSNSSVIRLSKYLLAWSEPCYEDEVWLVRCAFNSAKPRAR